MRTTHHFATALGLFVLLSASPVPGQDRLEPTQRDVAYAEEDPAQILDFYRAESDSATPVIFYLHGGGWRAGSKESVPPFLRQAVQEGWASVVAVEYRFTDVATHPAQVNDCMRAIQFVRSRAAEWNIDPSRVGLTGGSAGGHLSLWIALHDDIADPDSDDPVARRSSRAACAVGFAGPTDWSLLGEIEHGHPAYRVLLGYEPGTPAAEMAEEKKHSASPITFASKDDPPVLIVHGDADRVVPVEHARRLHKALQAAGADSGLLIVKDGEHNVAGARDSEAATQASAFFRQHLLGEAAAR